MASLLSQIANYGVAAPDDIGPYPQQVSGDSGLNFEQRVNRPSEYPSLAQDDGSIATHKMAWGEADGRYVAFPTIVQTGRGDLAELGPDEAFRYAMETGEFREFKTPQEADTYARGGYKQAWGQNEKGLAHTIQQFTKRNQQ